MDILRLTIALITVLGWAASADAGEVKKRYNLSSALGATAKTYTGVFTISASTITGYLGAAVYTVSSTFTSNMSNPPVTAWLHIQKSAKFTAMGQLSAFGWTVANTVAMHRQGTTLCHVAQHTAMSDTIIPASCHMAGVTVQTKAHCTGHGAFSGARCQGGFSTPGCWTGASDYHTQTWKAKSLHCNGIRFHHSSMSGHFVKSCEIKLPLPPGHTCASGSASHLASSNEGFHVVHVVAKLKDTP